MNDTHRASEVPQFAGHEPDVAAPMPLMPAQLGIWLDHARDPRDCSNNAMVCIHLSGPLDVDRFVAAVAAAVRQTTALRLRFSQHAGEPRQTIHADLRIAVPVIDLGDAADPALAADAHGAAEQARPFDLATAPLARFALLRLGPGHHRFQFLFHHLVMDGAGAFLFARRIAAHYTEAHAPPSDDATYRHRVAAELRLVDGERYAADRAFWLAYHADAAEAVHLTARARRDGALRFGRTTRSIASVTLEAGHLACRSDSRTGVLLAVLAAYAVRFAGVASVPIAVPLAGREEGPPCAGVFMRTPALRLRAAPDATLAAVVRQATDELAEARRHPDYPHNELLRELQRAGGSGDLFGLILNFMPFERRLDFDGAVGTVETYWSGRIPGARFSIYAPPGAAEAQLELEYDATLYRADEIALHADRFVALIGQLPQAADRALGALDIRLPAERDWLACAGQPRQDASLYPPHFVMPGHDGASVGTHLVSWPRRGSAASPSPLAGEGRAAAQMRGGRGLGGWGSPSSGLPAALLPQGEKGYASGEGVVPNEMCAHASHDGVSGSLSSGCTPATLADLFEAQVARAPQAPALVFGDETLSYQDLDCRANQMARRLIAMGFGPEDIIGLALPRSPDLIIALIGIAKAGAAFLPLDPKYPAARLAYMADDSKLRLAITDSDGAGVLPGDLPLITTDDPVEQAMTDHLPDGPLRGERLRPPRVETLAYVIYTSGSTGQPKGVLVTHRGLANLAEVVARHLDLGPGDRFLQFASTSFDASISEIVPALACGAALVLAPQAELMPGPPLAALAARHAITHMIVPPSALAVMAADSLPGVRGLCVAGEACPPALAARWSAGRRFINGYGPTENTVAISFSEPLGGDDPHLGAPMPGMRVHVVDERLGLVPIGAAGELLVGGIALARGYLGRPGLTAERFIPDPFGPPGERVYRTGDRVRWRPDGVLDYIGRNDAQVKLRGFRIELGEIEAALGAHPDVAQCAVVLREEGPQERHLIAYVVGRDPEAGPDIGALRAHVAQRLPAHMHPAAIVPIATLPLLPNGKIDRKVLPSPWREAAPSAAAPTPIPTDSLEQILTEIWSEVLGTAVAPDTDFFDHGGDSLSAIRMLSQVHARLQVELTLDQVFDHPTLTAFARCIRAAERALPAALPVVAGASRPAEIPLTFAQARLWFLQRLEGGANYNIPFALRIAGTLDVAALRRALDDVIARHEVLRTRYPSRQGVPRQEILPPAPVALAITSCDEAAARAHLAALAAHVFDLAAAPPLRLALLRLDEQTHILAAVIHHIAFDAWSADVFARQLAEAYARHSGEGAGHSPHHETHSVMPGLVPGIHGESVLQIADLALWQQAAIGAADSPLVQQLAFWREELAGAPLMLDLPTDRPREAGRGRRAGALAFAIDAELHAELAALARAEGTTLAVTIEAALALLLARHAGADDVLIGIPIANRAFSGSEKLIGCLLNTLVRRHRLAGNPTVAEVIQRAHATATAAYAHADYPFERLVDELRPERMLPVTPLFQVMLSHNAPPPVVEAAGLTLRTAPIEVALAKFDLTLYVTERAGPGLDGLLHYDAGLFDHATVERMMRELCALLAAMAARPQTRIATLDLMSAEEHRAALVRASGPALPASAETLVSLFTAACARHPDAVALIEGERSVSFGELERRANRLAHHLIAAGAAPGAPIGVCLERSIDLVVALLAVLKTAAPYVALDASQPAARIRHLVDDSGMGLIIARAAVLGALPCGAARGVAIDAETAAIAARPDVPPQRRVRPEDAAYLVYTSGSTGLPKGVIGLHRGAVARFQWMWNAKPFGPRDVTCHKTATTFVDSVWEIFGPLLAGVPAVIVDADAGRDPRRLVDMLVAGRATRIVLVPSLLRALIDTIPDLGRRLPQLDLWISSGEGLPGELAARFRAALPGRRLLNLYGSSEVSADVTCHEVGPADGVVPIGRPIAGSEVHVLDAGGAPVPVGVVGEIHVGGLGLAGGYHRRPGLTAERFVPNPFGPPGARLFATGDLGAWRADGVLLYHGRRDRQVKIRGMRVEPDEVRAALLACPGIADAFVRARSDAAGDVSLSACVVAQPGAAVGRDPLRRHLRAALPPHLVPRDLLFLPALPLNPSGKIDEAALPEPSGADESSGPAAPLLPDEQLVAELWGECLGRPVRDGDADFFDLGGHSLLAMRLTSRINQLFDLDLPVSAIFEAPSVKAYAERLRTARQRGVGEGRTQPLPPPSNARRAPLAPAQRGLWLISRLAGGSAAYNLAAAWRLRGALDSAALARSLAALVERHAVLRTRLAMVDGEPQQIVDPPRPVEIARLDCRAAAEGARAPLVAATALARDEATRAFRLDAGLPLRVAVIDLGDDDAVLSLVIHHTACDGWSGGLFMRELAALYGHHAAGLPLDLRPLAHSYIDYALWRQAQWNGPADLAELDAWRQALTGIPTELALPLDRPRPPVRSFQAGRVPVTVPPALVARLRDVAARANATLFVALLAAYGAILARRAGQSSLLVGIPVAARTRPEWHDLLGFFAGMLPLPVALADDDTVDGFIGRVRREVVASLDRQDVSFDRLVEALNPARDPALPPLIQAAFVLADAAPMQLMLPGLACEDILAAPPVARFDLTLTLAESEGGLAGALDYAADLFEPATIAGMAADWLTLLDAMAQQGDRPLAQALAAVSAAPPRAPARHLSVPPPREDAVAAAALHDRISAVWCRVLRRDTVGIDDNFFEVGGHSLSLVRVHAELEAELGRPLPITDLFRLPTVRALAAHLAGQAPAPEAAPETAPGSEPIAIIGMACRFPGAPDLDAFWRLLAEGREGLTRFSRAELLAAGVAAEDADDPDYVPVGAIIADAESFDAAFFGLSPREAEMLDPQMRVFLECAWHALEHAALDPRRAAGPVGIFAGVGLSSYLHGHLLPALAGAEPAEVYQAVIANDKDFLATHAAYRLDLRGPAMTVQTACSTSLVAVDVAVQSLRAGRCRAALAGGTAIHLPQGRGYRYAPGMILSPDGHCRAFDRAARGTVPGAGVGVVVLKPLSLARADGDRIIALIAGSAVNNDGATRVGYTAPSLDGQAAVIRAALRDAGLAGDAIDYVEAHGTGTELGDPIEMAALAGVLGAGRTHPCAIGAVKSNIGHADAAAGIAGLIKAALALEHGVIPPSLHYAAANTHADLAGAAIEVVTVARPWPRSARPRRAGVSSFGIGGTNAHVILEDAPAEEDALRPPVTAAGEVLVLSARSKSALATASRTLAQHLAANPTLPLADVAFTLQCGRSALPWRRVVVARTLEEAVDGLGADEAGRTADHVPVIFLFPGQGSQYPGMAAQLYRREPLFRHWLDRCCDGFSGHLPQDLRPLLLADSTSAAAVDRLRQTELAQPALFAVSYALARLWMEAGIEPAAMIGHSIGEYVAATLADVFTLDDALMLVAARGRLMQSLPGGAMLAAALAEPEAQRRLGPGLSLAAVNGPQQCVVSGDSAAIEVLAAELTSEGVPCHRLDTSHAFHSAHIDPVLARFAEHVAAALPKPPGRRFLSNVTGSFIRAEEAADPGYWATHLRATVRFGAAVEAVLAEGRPIFVEVGPGQALGRLARSIRPDATTLASMQDDRSPDGAQRNPGWGSPRGTAAPGLRHSPSKTGVNALTAPSGLQTKDSLPSALARLWAEGAPIRWERLHPAGRRRQVLPLYPFERRRYFIEAAPAVAPAAVPGKKADPAQWFYAPDFARHPRRALDPAALSGSWLLFVDEAGVGGALAAALAAHGCTVTCIEPAAAFARLAPDRYAVAPAEPAGYRALLDALQQAGRRPDHIVHLWTLDRSGDLRRRLDRGLHSLIHLAQAIGAAKLTHALSLTLLTRGTQEVTGEEALDPIAAAALGAVKVIPLEYSFCRCRAVDLPASGDIGDRLIPTILAEALDATEQPVVALRGAYRWLPQVRPDPLPAPAGAARLRPRGHYLITGGFGGMGSTIARDLAARCAARLTLIARTVPADDTLLQEIATSGGKAFAVAADVGDADALAAGLAAARARFGPVHGVIHAAGLADYAGIIQKRSRADTDAVLNAKIAGTLALDRAVSDAPLDFMLLCSSLGSVLYHGKFGQVGYVAANEFLDLFAAERSRRAGGITCSINWDDWAEHGMSVAASGRWRRAQVDENATLTPAEGVEVFHRALAAGRSRVIVSVRDLPNLIAHGADAIEAFAAATAPAPVGANGPARDIAPPATATEDMLAALWRELLGVAEVGREDDFFALGGHSLLATRIIAKLRARFHLELPLAALFEAPTLRAMGALVDRLREGLRPPAVADQPEEEFVI
jgi:amino acid adenylation domain-containing protein